MDIRLAKLEQREVEAGNEAKKWKRIYEDQAEVIRKLEVERDNAQANEAIRIIIIDELNSQIRELEAKLDAQATSDAAEPMVNSTSPDPIYGLKNMMMLPKPSFSIGLTQMDVDDCEGTSAEQITYIEKEIHIPTDMVVEHTRSKLEEASPPPNSAIRKIGLVKYAPLKNYQLSTRGPWSS